MADFLIEIGTEEIPARLLDTLRQQFDVGVFGFLNRYGLLGDSPDLRQAKPFSTPRRLAALVSGVTDRQPDKIQQVMGPAKKVAFKDGQPTAAAHAFAKKVGIAISKIDVVATAKGEYLSASVEEKGRSAQEIISTELPWVIAGWPFWPQTMQWLGGGQAQRFIRPIRWIVALLDSEIVPFEYAGIKAGRTTRGHRILGMGEQKIDRADQYAAVMANGCVVVSYEERERHIRKALSSAARTVPGARCREDLELLKTVINLTECPSAVLGSIDDKYLALPKEVLVTVMRDHQKYFAVEDSDGRLLPYFVAVLNTIGDPDGLIRHGNERVLRARFSDALFFWHADNRLSFGDRRQMLKKVTFQKDLGSYFEKTERVVGLVESVAKNLRRSGIEIDTDAVIEAASLAKNDLTTELVKEFTELQGVIGGLYVEYRGMASKAVADAVYDQYKPESMEDSPPRTLEGAVLSIADKADSIAGMLALGLIPSGSRDPFALRRQANGIVKTVAERNLPINLANLMEEARVAYKDSDAEKKFTLNGDAYWQATGGFFKERLEFYLRDALRLAYDVVNATLAADANDVVDAVARAQAVAKVRPSADFESISTSFKRMKNILRQAAETGKRVADPFNANALKEKEEKKLAALVPQVAVLVNVLRTEKKYEPALIEISKLRPAIDAFFDKVMVMVDDEKLRANRLGLLAVLLREFSSIADFSEIVTEGK